LPTSYKQDEDAKEFMQTPFVPEEAAESVSAALASADPRVLKGQALFQAQSCNSCHGEPISKFEGLVVQEFERVDGLL
jgi:hypothetical protein